MPNGYKSNDLPDHASISDFIAHLSIYVFVLLTTLEESQLL